MTYEIGQTVWFNTSRNYFSAIFIQRGFIERITPSGILVLDNGMRFKNGNQLRSAQHQWPCAYLINEDVALNEIKLNRISKRQNKLINKVEVFLNTKQPLTDAQEAALENLLKTFEV